MSISLTTPANIHFLFNTTNLNLVFFKKQNRNEPQIMISCFSSYRLFVRCIGIWDKKERVVLFINLDFCLKSDSSCVKYIPMNKHIVSLQTVIDSTNKSILLTINDSTVEANSQDIQLRVICKIKLFPFIFQTVTDIILYRFKHYPVSYRLSAWRIVQNILKLSSFYFPL